MQSSRRPRTPKAKKTLTAPRRLQQRYEGALGRLAIQFSLLHVLLEHFSWKTWGLHPEFASILTKDLPTKHLVEKLRATVKELQPELEDNLRDDLLRILKNVEKHAQERNELLHALWIIEDNKPVLCYKRRGGDPKAPTIEEIDTLSDSIIKAANGLIDFYQQNPLMSAVALALRWRESKDQRPVQS